MISTGSKGIGTANASPADKHVRRMKSGHVMAVHLPSKTFHWFKKAEPEDYETVLSSLAADVQKRQTRLSELRLRERRATLQVTLIALAIWVAYVSLWYAGFLTTARGEHAAMAAAKSIAVLVGPIIILFTRRIVQLWYARKGDAEERTLKEVLKKQRSKVEEIKKKTNYYSTRNLIEKYDESGSAAATPLRQRIVPSTPQPQAQLRPQLVPPQTPANGMQGPALQLSPTPQPMAPPRKQWYDKIADAILGDDDPNSINAAASRYALICEKCFGHNGLVKESGWMDAQYVCPKCGHFNASVRSKKETKQKASRTPSPPSRTPPTPPRNASPIEGEGAGEESQMEIDS
ncbi:hypothetical protein BJ138DRAFT_667086 [Hygrophoropsis aurantiaca]|uniref:Uncharacterized protein n=1 Tax=Hygrophoropsis aurantiaca TaxID=72124 RepID=A0ACB7ZYU7_9AGAM|nr:hypothetical protein BJ138DRAFT_667086 [Hygrophoropsis aurantiaca]